MLLIVRGRMHSNCRPRWSMDVRQRLAKNVRRLRHATGLGQEKFALEHGIDRTYVSGIERGARNPTILVVERFATALKVDVAELLKEPCEAD